MVTLRTVRITVASISFILITAIFLDITNRIPPAWSSAVVSLQFAPAVIKTISSLGIALAAVIFVSILTLLYGRVYCSHLCPLGTLQDIIIWIRKKKFKHRKFPYHPANYRFLYAVTALSIVSAIFGSAALLDLLEPFSNYGRILSTIVRPPIIIVNNALAIFITSTNSLGIAEIPLFGLDLWNVVLALFFLSVIIGLTVWRERLF